MRVASGLCCPPPLYPQGTPQISPLDVDMLVASFANTTARTHEWMPDLTFLDSGNILLTFATHDPQGHLSCFVQPSLALFSRELQDLVSSQTHERLAVVDDQVCEPLPPAGLRTLHGRNAVSTYPTRICRRASEDCASTHVPGLCEIPLLPCTQSVLLWGVGQRQGCHSPQPQPAPDQF